MKKGTFWMTLVLAAGMVPALNAARAQDNPAPEKTAPQKAAKSKASAPAAAKGGRVLGPAEDMKGPISGIDTRDDTVTITVNGTPYSFRIVNTTKIMINGQKGSLTALVTEANHSAMIHFVPRTDGNIAQSIDVTS